MIIIVIYIAVLLFFWIRTTVMTPNDDATDAHVNAFLAWKYQKILCYKQYAFAYFLWWFYLLCVGYISSWFLPEQKPENVSWQQISATFLSLPWWVQGMFLIALIGLIGLIVIPAKNAKKHQRQYQNLMSL